MNGLIFNLLETLADKTGCSEEAWELVAEFATAESILSDAPTLTSVAAPSQTMVWESYRAAARTMHQCLNLKDSEPFELASSDDNCGDWRDVSAEALPGWYTAVPHALSTDRAEAMGNADGPEWLDFSDSDSDDGDDWDDWDGRGSKELGAKRD